MSVTSVPRFQVNLDLPPSERWLHVVGVYAPLLRGVEAVMEAALKDSVTFPRLVEAVGRAAKACVTLDADVQEELNAIADAAGMSRSRIASMQLVYEAAAMCTSIVAPCASGAATELLAHARTMDWAMGFLRPLTVEIELMRGGVPVAIWATWVGYVGCLTGLALRPARSDNFSVAVNFRSVGSGTIATNLWQAATGASPVGFLVRRVVLEAPAYSDAEHILRTRRLIAPCYFTLCGVAPGDACLVTRDREEDLHFQPISSCPNGAVIQTNMDHWDADPDNSIMYSIERRERVARALRTVRSLPTCDALWSVLSLPVVSNSITVYGTLMVPALGTMEVRLPRPGVGLAVDDRPPRRVAHGGFLRCSRCAAAYDADLNPPGDCHHSGAWHSKYGDCGVGCGVALMPSNLGLAHWSCCYSTDPNPASRCKASAPHATE